MQRPTRNRPLRFPPPNVSSRVDLPPPAPPASTESVLRRFGGGAPVVISHERVVDGSDADILWEAYRANFEPLADLAVQQQSSDRGEMLAEFADPRITKIVAWEGGVPVGLGMVTNCFDAVPDVSAEFLRAKFPEQAARDAVYIGMYVMVAPGHRGLTLFQRLYLEMWQLPALVGGLLVFDVCEFNRTTFDTDALAARIAANFPRSSVDVLDRQTWYVAELPEPLPHR